LMPQPDPGPRVEIIVQLSPETSVAAVDQVAADIGATLQPLHPATSDAGLAQYAVVRVPRSQVDPVLAALRSSPDVDAAYVKPAGEAP
jgi:hypothetical protein